MFTFPNKGDTLDFFSLSGLSFFMVFLFWFALTMYSPETHVSMSALHYETEWVPFTFHSVSGWRKWQMNVRKQHVIPLFLFWRIPKKMQKCCECMIESVTCRTAHFWQFCLPKEYNWIEEKTRERFAVLCIKWCLFSILTLQVTSEGATSTGFCTYT